MKVEKLQDSKWPAWFADEDAISSTTYEHGIEQEELVEGIIEFQNRYNSKGTLHFRHDDHEGGLFRYLRQKEDVFVLRETDEFIVVLTSEDGSVLESSQIPFSDPDTLDAVLDHHDRFAIRNREDATDYVGVVRPNEQLLMFTRPNPQRIPDVRDNNPPFLEYDYTPENGIIEVSARWLARGENGEIGFKQEWTGKEDGTLTFTTTAQNYEIQRSNGGPPIVYNAEEETTVGTIDSRFLSKIITRDQRKPIRTKFPRFEEISFNDIHQHLTNTQKRTILRDKIAQNVFEERPMDYLNAVEESFTCEFRHSCDGATQSPEDSIYIIPEEIHPIPNIGGGICTDCFAEFVAGTSTLTQRQAHIFSYHRIDFSHSRIQNELNKRAETEDDEITRGAVSGALNAIKNKRDEAENTVRFIPKDMYTGI